MLFLTATKLNGGRYTDVYTDLKDLDPEDVYGYVYRSQRSTPHRSTMYGYTDLKNKKYHIMHAVNLALAYMHRKTLILFIPRIARGEWVGQ